MLEKIIGRNTSMELLSVAAVGLSLAASACGDDKKDSCAQRLAQQYSVGNTAAVGYSADKFASGFSYLQASSKCPKGCDPIGETEDQYCCWCPD